MVVIDCGHGHFEVKAEVRKLPGNSKTASRLMTLAVKCRDCGQVFELSKMGNISDAPGEYETLIAPRDSDEAPTLNEIKGWVLKVEGHA